MMNVRQAQLKLSTLMLALAMVAGTAAGARGATASWDANTEPDLAGYKLSYGTQPGVYIVVLDVGKVTTYQFYPPPGLRYYVVVQAYNTAGQLSAKSAEAIIDIPWSTPPTLASPNLAPVLAQPANQTTTVNALVSLPLSASDPEGKALTFTATGLPPGLAINSAARLISGSPGTVGSYQVTVTVSDGALSVRRSFSWTIVNVANKPPVFTQPANQTTTVNASVSLALSASDPEGKALTFTASGLPPGLSINSASRLISGIPNTVGSYQVTVTVSDGAASASRSFAWAIVTVANKPPVFAQPANQTTAVNASVLLALTASDPEGKPLTFTATGLPPGLAISSFARMISGVAKTAGTYQVTVKVSDGVLSVSRSFGWTVGSPTGSTAISTATENESSPSKPTVDTEINSSSPPDYVGVSGDFDGDGRTDPATYQLSSGEWRIWTSGSNFQTATVMVWGLAGDVPLPADYNGDRVTDLGVYRPSTGTWHLWLSGTQTPLAVQWGGPEDEPVTLDQDADGKADLALIRNGGYEILLSSANYLKSIRVQ